MKYRILREITETRGILGFIKLIIEYAFQDKHYPALLYNLNGSEGDRNSGHYTDNLIKRIGFWSVCWSYTIHIKQ